MLLSIVIPSYNHERFVLSTIQAAARIAILSKEIIVIDDGSSDASTGVIREYIASKGVNNNIRLIARENRGLVKTLNEGLSIALGKYFYVVASDDIPIPEGIACLVNILEKNDGLQFAMGNALVMHSEQQREFMPTYGAAHQRFFTLPADIRRKEMFMNYPNPLLLQATVFRTSALKDIEGWREDIILDDFTLFIGLLSRFPRLENDFAYHPEIMACFYRQHQANSYRNIERQFKMVEQALTKLCPLEWRDMAIARKCAYYSQDALRRGKLLVAARLFHSAMARVGIICLLHASASELTNIVMVRLSRAKAAPIPALTYKHVDGNTDNLHE